jgi:predicted aldo/keto reductase-like oxidoreductase
VLRKGDIREILSPIALGSMRFPHRESALETVAACLKAGVNYVDCSPGYGYLSEEENSEAWVGEALAGCREAMFLSTKCSPGNGGLEIGEEFQPYKGFGVRSAEQLRQVMEQSRRRLKTDHFDGYHLWTVHNIAQMKEAYKPGGWMEEARRAKAAGMFDYLGVTTHADSATIIEFLKAGDFEMVTLPYHLLDSTREEAVRWAGVHGIAVLAMNPLAGGLLVGNAETVTAVFGDMGIAGPVELALNFILSTPGMTSALCGMTLAYQVADNTAAVARPRWGKAEREEVVRRFKSMGADAGSGICTGCGYCIPCPQGLNIPRILRAHNAYYVLRLGEKAVQSYRETAAREEAYNASNCLACGVCETRCPNSLPVSRMMSRLNRLDKE